MSHSFRSYHIY